MFKKIFIPIVLFFLLSACCEQKKIVDSVSFDSVWAHLEQFDKIAKENNSNRAVGTSGGIASKDYIIEFLKKLGLNTTTQDFINRSGAKGCNLTVDIKGKSDEEIVMIGSHYDSVEFGPGINDNASGVAVLLEIISAIRENKITPEKTLRFSFWDSEETGVEGSQFYYDSLSESEKQQIVTYINIDMIATKGGEINISDTDQSTIDTLLAEYIQKGIEAEVLEMIKQTFESVKFAEGSLELEQLAKDIFKQYNITIKEDLQFAKNSDTNPFYANIPTLGITAIKINTEPREDGGVAILYAPCYHQLCDDIDNVDRDLLSSCLKVVSSMIETVAVTKR